MKKNPYISYFSYVTFVLNRESNNCNPQPRQNENSAENTDVKMQNANHNLDDAYDLSLPRKQIQRFAVGLTLCTSYCSKVGGMATLTGSPPNVIMKGQVDEYVLSLT